MIPATPGTVISITGEPLDILTLDHAPVVAWNDYGRPMVAGDTRLVTAEEHVSDGFQPGATYHLGWDRSYAPIRAAFDGHGRWQVQFYDPRASFEDTVGNERYDIVAWAVDYESSLQPYVIFDNETYLASEAIEFCGMTKPITYRIIRHP